MPWSTLPAASLLERYRYVNALRWTWREGAIFTNYAQRTAFSELGAGNGCAEIGVDLSAEWGGASWTDAGSFLSAEASWYLCTQLVSQASEVRVSADVACAATAELWVVETSLGTVSNTLTATAAIYAEFRGDLGDGAAFATFADTSPADQALVRLADVSIATNTIATVPDIGRTDTEPQVPYGCDADWEATCGPEVTLGWFLDPDIGGALVRWDFQHTIE
jgi:hypothetical protein